MKVLVVGAGGFIGTSLLQNLKNRGTDVTATSLSGGCGLQWDVMDHARGRDVFACGPFDVVVNLVAVGVGSEPVDPIWGWRVNTETPTNIARLLSDQPNKPQLIHVSSSTESLVVNEQRESVYSATKAEGTQSLLEFAKQTELRCSIVRVHNVYGSGQPKSRFVAYVIDQILREQPIQLRFPDRVRDFVYLDNVVEHLINLFTVEVNGIVEVEMGSGVGYSLSSVVQLVSSLCGKDCVDHPQASHSRPDPFPSIVADLNSASLLRCTTSLIDGLGLMIGGRS